MEQLGDLTDLTRKAVGFIQSEDWDKFTELVRGNLEFINFLLLTASAKGSGRAVQILLDHGANVNFEHPDTRRTPLLYCFYCNQNMDVLNLLVENGANITPFIKLFYSKNEQFQYFKSLLYKNKNNRIFINILYGNFNRMKRRNLKNSYSVNYIKKLWKPL